MRRVGSEYNRKNPIRKPKYRKFPFSLASTRNSGIGIDLIDLPSADLEKVYRFVLEIRNCRAGREES